ncbi:MAG: hypothetical protein QM817_10450 [Archangium sp.]
MNAHVIQHGPFEGRTVDASPLMVDIEAAKAWAEAALRDAEKEENEGLRTQHAQDIEKLNEERYRRWNGLVREPEQKGSTAPGAGTPPPAPARGAHGLSVVEATVNARNTLIRQLEPMLALTVWQPYAFAIAEGWKTVENRTWAPPKQLPIGARLAIHAAAKLPEADDVAGIREMLYDSRGHAKGAKPWHVPKLAEFKLGCVVAVATLAAVIKTEDERIVGALPSDQVPFYFGPFGWLLKDIKKLPVPVRARGMQGLWPLGGEELFAVHEQLRGAR